MNPLDTDFSLLIAMRAARLGTALQDARAHGLYESLERIAGTADYADLRVFVRTLSTTLSTVGFMRPDLRKEYERVHEAAIAVSNALWQAQRCIRVTVEVG